MNSKFRRFGLAAFPALFLCAAPDGPAPPTVALWGITNLASRMPPQLAGGRIAQGSLFRVTGWRLGPPLAAHAASATLEHSLAGSEIRIRQGQTAVSAWPVLTSAEEMRAVMPSDAPLGDAELIVIRDGQASRPAPVRIVESSFGAFSRNGHGWGPGEIWNSDGRPNNLQNPARPGETVRMAGTGLGPADGRDQLAHRAPARSRPAVTAGGKSVTAVQWAGRDAGQPGADELEFTLPTDVPEGCYVPVQTRTGQNTYSNSVTLAVSREGRPCADRPGVDSGRSATVSLVHLDLIILLGAKSKADFHTDLGYADFRAGAGEANPIYLFPPSGTCTGYTGFIRTHDLFTPLEKLSAGDSLDAGESIAITGPGGQRSLTRKNKANALYTSVLGGSTPLPMREPLPLFLRPGDYRIDVPGGPAIAPFGANVRVEQTIRWKNRDSASVVDRLQGSTVHWKAARPDDLIVIAAMNAFSPGDAVATCFCAARGSDGHFFIPPYALANLPASRPGQGNLPLNLLFLAEIHRTDPQGPAPGSLAALTLASVSASGRTVRFR